MPLPQTVTPEILAKHAHLTDYEVVQDSFDTQREIKRLIKARDGYRLVAEANMGTSKGRWAYFQERAAEIGIAERQEFVGYLERLLEARRVKQEVENV